MPTSAADTNASPPSPTATSESVNYLHSLSSPLITHHHSPDTRILLTLLLDPDARPLPKDMKLWVDCVRFVKRGAKGGALGFFTYAELSEYRLGVACYDMNIRETACGMMLTALP